METETLNLTIGGIDHDECEVHFEYVKSEDGGYEYPSYPEDLTIHKVEIKHDDYHGYDYAWWSDMQEIHFHLIEQQVLDWIHAKQEEMELDNAETHTERRMREMENEAWEPRR